MLFVTNKGDFGYYHSTNQFFIKVIVYKQETQDGEVFAVRGPVVGAEFKIQGVWML